MKRKGYGQVEPNHLSAQTNGQVYAQRPCVDGIEQLENGQFACYDVEGVKLPGDSELEPMLVYNEEKLYDERFQMHKDFVFKAADFYDGKMYPRLLRIELHDHFTTNTLVGPNTGMEVETTDDGNTYTVGQVLKINDKGFLDPDGTSDVEFTVVKVYTMPDSQEGIKVQRTK